MDPMVRWAIRIAQWFRQPPSRQQAIIMAVAFGAAFLIFAIERWVGWPQWMTMDNPPSQVRRP